MNNERIERNQQTILNFHPLKYDYLDWKHNIVPICEVAKIISVFVKEVHSAFSLQSDPYIYYSLSL